MGVTKAYLIRCPRGIVEFHSVDVIKEKGVGYQVRYTSGERKGKLLDIILTDKVILTTDLSIALEIHDVFVRDTKKRRKRTKYHLRINYEHQITDATKEFLRQANYREKRVGYAD